MEVLFQGIYIDKSLKNKIEKETNHFPYAQYKFESSFVKGLQQNNCSYTVLSTIPILRYPSFKKIFINFKDKEHIHYLFFINLPLLKQLFVLLSQFLFIINWSFKNRKKTKKYIIYGTNPLNCIIPLFLKYICNYNLIVIVSEINDYSYFDMSNFIKKLKKKLYLFFSNKLVNNFDGYILMSPHMNEKINKKNRPYIIIEAIYDDSGNIFDPLSYTKREKSILYAGSLLKKYGIAKLIESFDKLKLKDFTLDIYGNGDYVKTIKKIAKKNKQIRYFGTCSNDKIVDLERKAYLLVNPRPSGETITKYSFPSKTVEYLSSGTVSLITRLEGIPNEYYKYCYTFDDESIEGMSKKILEVLNMDSSLHEKKSIDALKFITKDKSSKNQVKKILDFIIKIENKGDLN